MTDLHQCLLFNKQKLITADEDDAGKEDGADNDGDDQDDFSKPGCMIATILLQRLDSEARRQRLKAIQAEAGK